ncbi:MAG: ROK family protein [Ruminococcaceae bacterium]|nr:ROK family protein [Oscillospiraceae bacterium]
MRGDDKVIGFDIGGTKCAVCVGRCDKDRIVIENKMVMPTNCNISPYDMIECMCKAAEEMTDDFSSIGISCGGPLDSDKGVIMSPPNLPGWDNVTIVDYLKNKYGGKVKLQNDANACAVAEWKFGAGIGSENMIFLTFGTGLGAGLILNSQLYCGTNDMAGEVGHIRLCKSGPVGYGKEGSFEGFCSGGGIAQLGKMYAEERLLKGEVVSFCQSRANLDEITAKTIAQKAYEGFEDAVGIYKLCGERLGQGLSILVDILNPDKIVIGSIYQRAEKLLVQSMKSVLESECLPASLAACSIVPAALGDSIGDYAAISVAALNE